MELKGVVRTVEEVREKCLPAGIGGNKNEEILDLIKQVLDLKPGQGLEFETDEATARRLAGRISYALNKSFQDRKKEVSCHDWKDKDDRDVHHLFIERRAAHV